MAGIDEYNSRIKLMDEEEEEEEVPVEEPVPVPVRQ
jgi:hypothetical protein